jgi:hypothetical protein
LLKILQKYLRLHKKFYFTNEKQQKFKVQAIWHLEKALAVYDPDLISYYYKNDGLL